MTNIFSTATAPVELADGELENVAGGILIGLLLPAVQKVREAAAGDGSVMPSGVNVAYGDGSVRF